MRLATIFFAAILTVSFGAQALTGGADSAAGSLETISPALQEVSVVAEQSLSVTFSEPMLLPGAASPGNYAISGLGAGTLNVNPDAVSGTGPYAISWNSGEMQDGASITVTASGVQDALGNPIDPARNSASCAGLGTVPVFSDLVVTPLKAWEGKTVTIAFSASEPLIAEPEVMVNGHSAAWISGGKAVNYVYEYTVGETDPLGEALVSVAGFDLAGNAGDLSSDAVLEIIQEPAGLPVSAWPAVILVFLAGYFGLRRLRGRRGMSVLLLITFSLCLSAFAENPAVSNVTFSQSPDETLGTKVDIYYDLTAPNGPCGISVFLSKDGGTDGFVFPVTTISGDTAGVSTGTGNHIVWDIRADYPEESIPNAVIRVVADDGFLTLTYAAAEHGSISGVTPQFVAPGASGQAVTAVPGAGYHFAQWSDGVLTAERTDTNVTADINVTASFAINTYTLTYTAGMNGTIAGISPQTVNYGGSGSEVTAVPNSGCAFSQWSDGVLTAARTDTNVTSDISVTALFSGTAIPEITSFAICNGAGAAIPADITLNNTAINGPEEYMASESASFTGATWLPYAIAPAFAFSSSVGPHTVYFKVRNAFGESNVASDSIFLVSNMLPVPAGTFIMGRSFAGDDDPGNENEEPRHPVTLGAYQIGKYEVTNKEYCDVLNWALSQGELKDSAGAVWGAGSGDIYAGGAGALNLVVAITQTRCNIRYSGGTFSSKTRTGLPDSTSYSMDSHPMVMVTWFGAVAFCNWLSAWQGLSPCYDMDAANWPLITAPPVAGGYRLPTEAEWERAAAWDGNKHWIYGFTADTIPGPGSNARCNYLWDEGDPNGYCNPLGLLTRPFTSPAGWFNGLNVCPNGDVPTEDSASPVGAYDMSGNAWEWCHDWYELYTADAQANPTGPETPGVFLRTIRGGGWYDNYRFCRTAYRGLYIPAFANEYFGFRIARTAFTQHVLAYTAETGGSISGATPQIVIEGGSGTAVTAVAENGYLFAQWSDGVTDNPRLDSNVTADIAVTAGFTQLLPELTSFAISGGAAAAMSPNITLDTAALNAPAEYLASESESFTDAVWQPYAPSAPFTLSFGVGVRKVYFKVRNGGGESTVANDTIFLLPQMVAAAEGTYDMGRTSSGDDAAYGETDELPVHSVTLGAYEIGQFEVTNKEYCDVLNWASAQGYLKDSAGDPWAGAGDLYAGGDLQPLLAFATSANCNVGYSGGRFTAKIRIGLPGLTAYPMDTHPVVCVSWYGAAAFCNWLNEMQGLSPCYDMNTASWPLLAHPPAQGAFRLPSEAEWERAAGWDPAAPGGPKHWIYGFMSDTLTGKDRANYYDNNPDHVNPLGVPLPRTSPAGWFDGVHISPNGNIQTVDSPSPLGCYDMSGNAWEWCHDWYLDTYYADGGPDWANPFGPSAGSARVLRGGGYWSTSYCRTARRYSAAPADMTNDVGFRLAR